MDSLEASPAARGAGEAACGCGPPAYISNVPLLLLMLLKSILGSMGFRLGDELGIGMLGMLRVGVGERESGGLGVGGERRVEGFELGTLSSLEALRMLRGATAWAAKGAGEMGRWEGRGPAGRAGLGWSDCIVVDEEEGGRSRNGERAGSIDLL